MGVQSFNYSELQRVNSFDSSSATIAAISAPGAGKRIAIKSMKLNVLTADTVTILSGATEKDRFYFGSNGGIDKNFGNEPFILGVNEALNFGKTAATTMSWAIQYTIV